MESQPGNYYSMNSIYNQQKMNINENSQENEFQKMAKYYQKIEEYRKDNYIKCLIPKTCCDCYINGEWEEAFIEEVKDNYIYIIIVSRLYLYNDQSLYKLLLSDRVTYFRKHTKPSEKNIIPQRKKKKELIERLKLLQAPEKKNIFKNDKEEDPDKIYKDYYYLHSIVNRIIDFSICRSKEPNNGVEEGFRIIIIVLEILSEFYHYIKDNFEEFINYKNNIEKDSELADLVLFNKKYATFSFWDNANLLMNKIFLNNINYIDWFIESEKILQKIIPSSQNMKKITSNEKLLCPLYENQLDQFKFSNYKYYSNSGYILKLKRICMTEAYQNLLIEFKGFKYNAYIMAYLIDYFFSLGGYNALFSLCKANYNIKIASKIFDNILYGCTLTNYFAGIFEVERNGINSIIFKFLDTITLDTLQIFQRNEIISFLKKACNLYPNINPQSTFMFEEVYIRFLLKILTLEKKKNKKMELLNELNNILIAIEYNQIFDERNYKKNPNFIDTKNIDEIINNPKYRNRDKLIKEMNYNNFSINCKNNHIIEFFFKEYNAINEEILIELAPILLVMYKNNFGYRNAESSLEEVKNIKSLVFNTILNKLKQFETENINIFSQIIKILNDFCKILSDEDKFFIFSEIKTIFINSFFNQNVTVKEIFDFIINYSITALKNSNIYSLPETEKDNKEKNKVFTSLFGININQVNQEDINCLSFDEKKYYGLELIYNYLSFEPYDQIKANEKLKLDIINSASKGILSIISNIKSPKSAINIVLNKICNSIKNKKDVLQNIILLNRFLLYSKIDHFYTEFEKCFNEFLQRVELIIIIIDELFSYLDNLEKNKIININSINEINENINNINNIEYENKNESQYEYLKDDYNIEKRIKTIFSVIIKYNRVSFDYSKIEGFFTRLIKFNEFCKNTLYQYLLKSLNSFSNNLLSYLFFNIISKKEIFKINSLESYQICKKIIILINKNNKSLYLMNNKDLGISLDKKGIENNFVGINLIWNFLLNEEQNIDNNIINDLTDFLTNIYFGVRIKSQTNIYKAYEEYWYNLINKMISYMNKFANEKNKNIKAIKCLISLLKNIIKRANNDTGEIIKDLKEIDKESILYSNNNNNKNTPIEYTFIGNKIGIEDFFIIDIKVNFGELFYILRYKLSYYYKIPVNQIGISVYLNTLGKTKKITQKEMEKICAAKPLKEFNYLLDFDNIYDQLIGLSNYNNAKKKHSLLIVVKNIKNKDNNNILKINLIEIIYQKTNLPIILMDLLKEPETPYTYDVLSLIKENKNSNILYKEIINTILNNKTSNLFNFDNTSIYYKSYIINLLNLAFKVNLDTNIIEKFIKHYIWNNCIKNLDVFNNNNYKNENSKKMPMLGELYEKYNLINNLLNIYIIVAENLGKNDKNQVFLIIYNIIKIYNYIINESININLNKCGKSERVCIEDVKRLYNESISNMNYIIINNEIIFNYIITAMINNDKNFEEIQKIKNAFEYIIFESILRNKYKTINKRIKELIFNILNKIKNYNTKEYKMFYISLFNLYINEKSFDKIIYIFKEINDKNNNNNFRFENNATILFDIISEILIHIYSFIQDKFDINLYINNVLLPKIYNMYIPNIPVNSIIHQLMLGGACKLLFTILMMNNKISYILPDVKSKSLIEYLFNNIIMPKCNENILTEENLNNQDNTITITSSFCIKEATNLFILLLFKNDNTEEIYNYYIQKITSFHKLCFWKGDNLSDWKLYFKENQKSTQFVGLKNLGCTCYINSLLQTFFNIPLFRESILNIEYTSKTEKNCFYQLKKVFYSLKYLQTSYYIPMSFVENYDNVKLNVSEQMDAFEFFCDFLDKIEEKIKKTKNENLIKYFFMGRQNDVIKFEGECNHHRTNESQFYSIQLQVQGKKNIYDSLNSFVEGEKMNGDNCINCPQCNKKYPAIKSQNFKTLPRIFMFVLKRFEFNYQTMQKIKINDYYEFPLILDMNKYTEKYLSQNISEDNMYKLKSIIIHTGTCESGHYYSYILDEKSNDWYEFNDTRVQKINITTLDVEAYGKKEIINDANGNAIEVENVRNAYILFYEKINKDNCEQFNNIDIINELLSGNNIIKSTPKNNLNNINNINEDSEFNLFGNENNNNNINDINTNEIQSNNNQGFKDILEPINEEMFKYFLNQRLFSGEYHYFVLSLFINALIKYNCNQTISFSQNLCSNNSNSIPKEVTKFKQNRKTPDSSNLENYLLKKKLYIFYSYNHYNINEIGPTDINQNNDKILELFKNLIIYFFNAMIRAREKDYLGGTVNLIKYFINTYIFCSDYLVEEFSNYNVLMEYMINCPSYNIKKLVVGILYCAMIKSVTYYENSMKQQKQNSNSNINNQINSNTQQNNNLKQNMNNENKKEQEMSDEEYARKLQEELNSDYSNSYNSINVYNNDETEMNSNPLDRKYIPQNVLKLIYNTLHIIRKIKFSNLNEARFLYFIIYRFSLITKKTRKFLLNKALVLELINVLLLPEIKEEHHEEGKIVNSIDKGEYKASHDILNTHDQIVKGIYDKGGAFHYENYINLLYFYLLMYNQKQNPKHPYFEGSYNFHNKRFIKALLFKINTKQDAYIFFFLIWVKFIYSKNAKKYIDFILSNLFNILERADNNEKINYDVNKNRDNYNGGVYSGNNNSMIDYENDVPKINPKYIILILKRFIVKSYSSSSDNNKSIDDYKINISLKYIFKLFENNSKYYNYSIMIIDFITELFINNNSVMNAYINPYSQNLNNIINWLKAHPISPELYPIEGLSMYKDDNVAYKQITDEEKIKFDKEQNKKTEKRIQKINNIIEMKIKGYDYEFEADFDLTDFNFRKGDYIYYNKKRAVIKESLDELIFIKIVDGNSDKNENKDKKGNEIDDDNNSINDIEKIKFWIAKDDKNISVYGLD